MYACSSTHIHTCGDSDTVLRSHTLRTWVGRLASDLTVKKIKAGCPPSAFPASASAVAIGKRASSTCHAKKEEKKTCRVATTGGGRTKTCRVSGRKNVHTYIHHATRSRPRLGFLDARASRRLSYKKAVTGSLFETNKNHATGQEKKKHAATARQGDTRQCMETKLIPKTACPSSVATALLSS